jgi:hypothetical protein
MAEFFVLIGVANEIYAQERDGFILTFKHDAEENYRTTTP